MVDVGYWILDADWILYVALDVVYWILYAKCWALVVEYGMCDSGDCMMDVGYCALDVGRWTAVVWSLMLYVG